MAQEREQVILAVWPRWLNKERAADYLSVSVKQIERYISSGKLPISRPTGGHLRIDKNDLDAMMEAHKVDLVKKKRAMAKRDFS